MRIRVAAVAASAALCVPGAVGAQEGLDDILGGFEDEDPTFAVERSEDEGATTDGETSWVDLSGSFETSLTVNYLRHRSSAGPPPNPASGTQYVGLQRWRNRVNLQLDADLTEHWQARVEAWGFLDLAYAVNGRRSYTNEVLDEYEIDADFGESWVHGKLLDEIDLKLGRQIVIWGRSETLRVLDVLNPLDNREPGRVDIEDLRLPLAMARLDAYQTLWGGDWSLSLIAIPEIRFDFAPVIGSDFFPGPTFPTEEDEPADFKDPEAAARILGIYHGWDVSLHAAWFWNDTARFHLADPASFVIPVRLVHDRLWLVGVGSNYTTGSWLFKLEAAYLDGFDYEIPTGPVTVAATGDKARVDVMVGFEYYGLENTTISVEGANRHVFDYEAALRGAPNYVQKDSQEIALRYTRNFFNEKLDVTLLAVLLDWDADRGSVVRLSADYELAEALSVGGGIVLYQNADAPPLDFWGRNDRLIFNLKWSF